MSEFATKKNKQGANKMKILKDKVVESSKVVSNIPESYAGNAEKYIWDLLSNLGIYDDSVSNDILISGFCKEGDARKVFCDDAKIPVPRFRKIWSILSETNTKEPIESKPTDSLTKQLIQTLKPIGQYTDEDLLKQYSPICDAAVENELLVRSNGRNCIIFKDKNTIDIENSLKLLREARRRDVPRTFKIGKTVQKVYKISEFPEEIYIKCPVTGCILFDNYSEKLGVNWEIPYEALQFIAVMTNERITVNAITARDLQKEYKENGIDGLRNLYPKISTIYDELKEIGDLPNLQTKLDSRSIGKIQDPFNLNKRF